MSIREEIKSILAKENIKMIELAERASNQLNKKVTAQSISEKLSRGTIKYEEAKFLIELLGYKIKIEKD